MLRIGEGRGDGLDGCYGKAMHEVRLLGNDFVACHNSVAHQVEPIIGETHQIELAGASLLKNGKLRHRECHIEVDLLEQE